MTYPVSASAMTGTDGCRLQTIWAAYKVVFQSKKGSNIAWKFTYADEIIQSGDCKIRLTQSRGSSGGTTKSITLRGVHLNRYEMPKPLIETVESCLKGNSSTDTIADARSHLLVVNCEILRSKANLLKLTTIPGRASICRKRVEGL